MSAVMQPALFLALAAAWASLWYLVGRLLGLGHLARERK